MSKVSTIFFNHIHNHNQETFINNFNNWVGQFWLSNKLTVIRNWNWNQFTALFPYRKYCQ